jgi:hypothetical protein
MSYGENRVEQLTLLSMRFSYSLRVRMNFNENSKHSIPVIVGSPLPKTILRRLLMVNASLPEDY